MQLNSLERRMSNIRLVPKVVLLMVFSTLLLLAKLWFDASNLEATLLGLGEANCPNADAFFDGQISFPFQHWLSEEDFDYMLKSTREVLESLRQEEEL